MAFLLMDFRPLKAVFEKLFMPPILEKRLNHDAIRTKVQIFKNHLARDILFLRRRVLYPAELLRQVTVAIIPVFRPDCKCPLQFCARFLILQDGHEPLHGLRLRGNLRQYRTIPALRLKRRSGGCGT